MLHIAPQRIIYLVCLHCGVDLSCESLKFQGQIFDIHALDWFTILDAFWKHHFFKELPHTDSCLLCLLLLHELHFQLKCSCDVKVCQFARKVTTVNPEESVWNIISSMEYYIHAIRRYLSLSGPGPKVPTSLKEGKMEKTWIWIRFCMYA